MNECFLCPAHSGNALIHPLKVVEGSVTHDVFVCDGCFVFICEGKDSIVANMWLGWKEAQSSGYGWGSFIGQLRHDFANLFPDITFQLRSLIFRTPDRDHWFFAAISNEMYGDLQMLCTSGHPIPAHAGASVAGKPLLFDEQTPFLHGRWLFGTMNGTEWTSGSQQRFQICHAIATKKMGDPPDPFRWLAREESRSGYELIRRYLL